MIISEKAMATHSSTFARQIPWTEEPGRLQSMGLLGVGHDWATSLSLFTFMHWRRKWQCSCLENPRDGGAWWAAIIYGVTQSRTRLKRVSSSMLKVFNQISHSRIHSSDLQQPWKVQTVSLRLSVLGLCNLKNYWASIYLSFTYR